MSRCAAHLLDGRGGLRPPVSGFDSGYFASTVKRAVRDRPCSRADGWRFFLTAQSMLTCRAISRRQLRKGIGVRTNSAPGVSFQGMRSWSGKRATLHFLDKVDLKLLTVLPEGEKRLWQELNRSGHMWPRSAMLQWV